MAIQMCDRATEDRLQVYIMCSTAHFSAQHSLLDSSLKAATDICIRALILNKIAVLEEFMIELWNVSRKYCDCVPPLPDFILMKNEIDFGKCNVLSLVWTKTSATLIQTI